MNRIVPLVILSVVTSVTLGGCAVSEAQQTESSPSALSECAGVRVVVDFAELGPEPIDECVTSDGDIGATELVDTLGLSTEGTAAYGNAVLCRLDGFPAADTPVDINGTDYFESCESMPSADAYWAVWVNTGAGWEYASVGFADVVLAPGESLALLFNVLDGATAPNDSNVTSN